MGRDGPRAPDAAVRAGGGAGRDGGAHARRAPAPHRLAPRPPLAAAGVCPRDAAPAEPPAALALAAAAVRATAARLELPGRQEAARLPQVVRRLFPGGVRSCGPLCWTRHAFS